jgi:hypothetical protein
VKPSSPGERANASAIRSTSHDETTDPRRQTSATSATSMSYWYASGSPSGAVSASAPWLALPKLACLMMLSPSAIEAIIPYSTPL